MSQLQERSKKQGAQITSLRRQLRALEQSAASAKDTVARLASLERKLSQAYPRALVLLYHRIADLEADPWMLGVTPEHFDEHLAALHDAGHVISLSELKRRLEDGSLRDRSIAVTFDDGYADNLKAALPLLQRHQVPATVFVSTGILSSDRDFWWDDIDRLFLQTERLPATLRLTIAGQTHEWDLGNDAVYSDDARRRHRAWREWDEPDPTARQTIFREIYSLLYPLGEDERNAVVDELLAWGGLSPFDDRRSLTPDELLELSQGELIEIGAHSVTHRLLAAASAEDQQREIQRSKEDLERILGRSVTSFAYPFGKREDYTGETVELVKASGFQMACSNFGGTIQTGTDMHQLPRMFMGDWTGEQLMAQLDAWFDDAKPSYV